MEKGKPIDQAYLSIVGRLKRSVVGIVPPKEVEDIVQEAYVRACQAERESPITAPRSFLFKTVLSPKSGSSSSAVQGKVPGRTGLPAC